MISKIILFVAFLIGAQKTTPAIAAKASTDGKNKRNLVQGQITSNVILRLETLLTGIPGGDAAAIGCKIDNFVDNCVANNVEGVSVELKRSDVNMNVASPGLGHLYFESVHSNTAVYTGKGYHESFLFDLLTKLRAEGIKTYAWWPTFNDAILAQSNSTNSLHTRFNFNSSDPSDLTVSTQFVSPHSDVVRSHQLDMINEILTHPSMAGWDGVRLDYIRFNYDEDDFSQPARDKYNELYGSDPLASVQSKFEEDWKSFRRDAITSFLQEATTLCHNYDPNLDVGGYVLPFPAHAGGFDLFQGQGNDFTKYHSFGFRLLPMVYYQDWGTSSNFEAWTKEKVKYSVDYSTDSPAVWPTLSITTTDWCGDDESCHRQHIVDALLIAANSGEEAVNYGSRTVEMFNYAEWGKIEWDRLSHALSSANEIISTGTVGPTPSPDPNDCTYFVPCGYEFYPGKDSPGSDGYVSDWRNIQRITLDCDADPGCKGFNSNGYTKSGISDEQQWVDWTTDPCLGLYVKGISTTSPTASPETDSSTQIPSYSPSNPSSTSSPSTSPSKAPSSLPTKSPVVTTLNPTQTPTPPPSSHPTNSCPYPVPDGYDFFPNQDSRGFDWGPFNWRNIPAIADDCNGDAGCVAFNSNGWLKWEIRQQEEWEVWTSDPCLGIYVKQSLFG